MTKPLATFLVPMSFMFFQIACSGEDQPKQDLQKPVAVKTIAAATQALPGQATYSGTVEPIERVRLSTKIMGWVEKIYFDEGESVKKGAPLVKLRSQDLEAKQAQAEAAISEAEIYFTNAQTNLQRIETLYEKKAATQKELDDMRAAFASAQAKKKTALEMKKEVEELLKYTSLSASFDGVVTRKMLQEGDLANPGQPILEVENIGKVKIVATVPESEIQSLQVGMPVQISVQAAENGLNGKSLQPAIDRIVPAADPMSRQFEMHIVMDNPEARFKSGMFARIATGTSDTMTLLVPQTAIFRRGQLEGLFVVDSGNRARLRWVRTGAEHNDLIEILTGLNVGERVVIETARQLLDGQRVEVME